MIVSMVQTKGGTGKSTLAQCLAFSPKLAQAFDSIALVEMDEQKTLHKWWQARRENGRKSQKVDFYHISTPNQNEIRENMERVIEKHGLVLIDVPGESVSRFRTIFACSLSDLILIPLRTSTHDEDALENLLPIIKEVIASNPEKRETFCIVPAFTHPRTKKEKLSTYFSQALPEYVRCLDAVFPLRSVYENFNREGYNLKEYGKLVRNNRREYKQVRNAEKDISGIAAAILRGV